jgi:hypothetical protein
VPPEAAAIEIVTIPEEQTMWQFVDATVADVSRRLWDARWVPWEWMVETFAFKPDTKSNQVEHPQPPSHDEHPPSASQRVQTPVVGPSSDDASSNHPSRTHQQAHHAPDQQRAEFDARQRALEMDRRQHDAEERQLLKARRQKQLQRDRDAQQRQAEYRQVPAHEQRSPQQGESKQAGWNFNRLWQWPKQLMQNLLHPTRQAADSQSSQQQYNREDEGGGERRSKEEQRDQHPHERRRTVYDREDRWMQPPEERL